MIDQWYGPVFIEMKHDNINPQLFQFLQDELFIRQSGVDYEKSFPLYFIEDFHVRNTY